MATVHGTDSDDRFLGYAGWLEGCCQEERESLVKDFLSEISLDWPVLMSYYRRMVSDFARVGDRSDEEFDEAVALTPDNPYIVEHLSDENGGWPTFIEYLLVAEPDFAWNAYCEGSE